MISIPLRRLYNQDCSITPAVVGRVYLATPYTHEENIIQTRRYNTITRIAARLIGCGFMIYSPITHDRIMSLLADLPEDQDFWSARSESFLLHWAESIFVYTGEGWIESIGVAVEIALAKSANIPIYYVAGDL